jgi:toxin ParE1/3/4
MKYRLLIKAEAIRDMTEAFDWYEEKRTGLGTEFLDELEGHYDRITHDPQHYPSHHGQRIAVMHRFPYKIVFEIEGDAIAVYAVYHHKRDPQKLAERK